MERRAVFLDRDGVINDAVIRNSRPYPPSRVEETVVGADVEPALKRLKLHGFLLLVVTNQPDVRRGATSREAVEQIHEYLSERLPLDEFFVCYHDDEDGCSCRKPLPGLLVRAAEKHEISIPDSYLIGDRWRDIEAGAAAGCRTILIARGYHERAARVPPDATVSCITGAVDWILAQSDSAVSGASYPVI